MPRPLRVLVVDDHPDTAEATAQLLALHGHDARPARSCAEAVWEVGDGFVPDVVILDVLLPDGDGYTLAADLCRLVPARPALVAVTGLAGQDNRCRAEGFDHHFLKPAAPTELADLMLAYAAKLRPD